MIPDKKRLRIVALLGEGAKPKDVARRVKVSVGTVYTVRRELALMAAIKEKEA